MIDGDAPLLVARFPAPPVVFGPEWGHFFYMGPHVPGERASSILVAYGIQKETEPLQPGVGGDLRADLPQSVTVDVITEFGKNRGGSVNAAELRTVADEVDGGGLGGGDGEVSVVGVDGVGWHVRN